MWCWRWIAAASWAQTARHTTAVWCGSAQETVADADAVVIATEWTEFSALDFAELKTALRQPVLFDLRNVYRKADAEAAGLEYHGTGVAPTPRSAGT